MSQIKQSMIEAKVDPEINEKVKSGLMGNDSATIVKRCDTRENTITANRPTLILTFDQIEPAKK